jgi:urease accessory protein
MDHDTKLMRRGRPYVFSNMRTGEGVQTVIDFIEQAGGLASR